MAGCEEALGEDVKGGGVEMRMSEAEGLEGWEGEIRRYLFNELGWEGREGHVKYVEWLGTVANVIWQDLV